MFDERIAADEEGSDEKKINSKTDTNIVEKYKITIFILKFFVLFL